MISRKKLHFSLAAIVLTAFIALYTLAAAAQDDDPAVGPQMEWVDEDHPMVVELFTSSNCSACVQADRILFEIGRNQPGVITLGCHVDYWDNTAEFEPEGFESCAYRQWSYRNQHMTSGTKVEIPYFIINGGERIKFQYMDKFYNRLKYFKGDGRVKPMKIDMKWKDTETITITLPIAEEEIDSMVSYSVWLIRFKGELIERIDEGQTAGRVLRFTDIVQQTEHIAKWHGESRDISINVGKPPGGAEAGGYVTIIQTMNGSEILAAGKVEDYRPEDVKKHASKKPKSNKPTAKKPVTETAPVPETQESPTPASE